MDVEIVGLSGNVDLNAGLYSYLHVDIKQELSHEHVSSALFDSPHDTNLLENYPNSFLGSA